MAMAVTMNDGNGGERWQWPMAEERRMKNEE